MRVHVHTAHIQHVRQSASACRPLLVDAVAASGYLTPAPPRVLSVTHCFTGNVGVSVDAPATAVHGDAPAGANAANDGNEGGAAATNVAAQVAADEAAQAVGTPWTTVRGPHARRHGREGGLLAVGWPRWLDG